MYLYQLIIHAGLNITEVAHDIQTQVSKYVRDDLKLVNSYDTWHQYPAVLQFAVTSTWIQREGHGMVQRTSLMMLV